jgi:hypothetical protein
MSEGQNPFLLTPRPASGEPAAPAAAPSPAPEPEFESGTHRVRAPRTSPLPVAVPAFFPTVPGAAPAAPRSWRLELMDGTERAVEGPVLIGRDPVPSATDGTAALLPVADAGKSVSKTHALLEPRGDELLVTDLGSTNGTTIVRDGTRAAVASTERLADGDVLMVGNVEIRVTLV